MLKNADKIRLFHFNGFSQPLKTLINPNLSMNRGDKHIFGFSYICIMSKDPKSIKKKVVPTKPATGIPPRRTAYVKPVSFPLLFSKKNYTIMAIGVGLIAIGMILMLGGAMKDPNQWDESVIYSFRRITLAPIIILTGLAVEIYAIFKK